MEGRKEGRKEGKKGGRKERKKQNSTMVEPTIKFHQKTTK